MHPLAHAFPLPLAPPGASLHGHDTVTLSQAVGLLASVGDLGMGQPLGSAQRIARLAARIAAGAGGDVPACAHARMVAQLRWSGCGASAAGCSALLGDELLGRHALLGRTLTPTQAARLGGQRHHLAPLIAIEREVAGNVAAIIGLPAAVEHGLRHAAERDDGADLAGAALPTLAAQVALAGDIEILARVHGLAAALALVTRLGGRRYPASLVAQVAPHAPAWRQELDAAEGPLAPHDFLPLSVPLTLVADIAELKLPWLAGHSRRVALLAQQAGQLAGLAETQQRSLVRAALLHGIGRVAIPYAIWARQGKLGSADWDTVRRAPYWSARIGSQVGALEADAQLAAQVSERLDGSGYGRRLGADTLGMPQRLLAAAAVLVALRAPRPWRAAHTPAATRSLLEAQVTGGRLDRAAVGAVLAIADRPPAPAAAGMSAAGMSAPGLTASEIALLQRLSLGHSEPQAARAMRISYGAVRSQRESLLGKLGCATRPAATLRALTLGLI